MFFSCFGEVACLWGDYVASDSFDFVYDLLYGDIFYIYVVLLLVYVGL